MSQWYVKCAKVSQYVWELIFLMIFEYVPDVLLLIANVPTIPLKNVKCTFLHPHVVGSETKLQTVMKHLFFAIFSLLHILWHQFHKLMFFSLKNHECSIIQALKSYLSHAGHQEHLSMYFLCSFGSTFNQKGFSLKLWAVFVRSCMGAVKLPVSFTCTNTGASEQELTCPVLREREMAWQSKGRGIKTSSKSFLRSEQTGYEANRWSRHERNSWTGQGCCLWPRGVFCSWDVHSGRNHAETLFCGGKQQRSCQMEENERFPTNLWALACYQNWVMTVQTLQRSVRVK